jgi:hypothetical protein
MLNNRARRIAYLEKLTNLRRQEKKRLMQILEGSDSLSKKVRTRGYLSQVETEITAELSEIEALKVRP